MQRLAIFAKSYQGQLKKGVEKSSEYIRPSLYQYGIYTKTDDTIETEKLKIREDYPSYKADHFCKKIDSNFDEEANKIMKNKNLSHNEKLRMCKEIYNFLDVLKERNDFATI